jgi:hypothetical protein
MDNHTIPKRRGVMKYSILGLVLLSFLIIGELGAQSTKVGDIACPQAEQLYSDFLKEGSAFWQNSDAGSFQEKIDLYQELVNKYKLRIRMAYCRCYMESASDSATIVSVQQLYSRLQAELTALEEK